MITGRIDTHAHLLPGIDDGCRGLEDSIRCARTLIDNGYTHAFCTPHIWPSYPHITRDTVLRWTEQLQSEFDAAGVNLTLLPGGEMNIFPRLVAAADEYLVTYNMAGKYGLVDIWCDECPGFFDDAIRHLQSRGMIVILAHPERMKAVQRDVSLIDHFQHLGLRLQGNLQCLADPIDAPTRVIAEKLLLKGRYFMLGSDTHNPQSMDVRMRGLQRAIELVGEKTVNRLTIDHPRELL